MLDPITFPADRIESAVSRLFIPGG